MNTPATLGLLAGILHELFPAAYNCRLHPVDPAAVRDAEQLLAALDEQGVAVATTTTNLRPEPTHTS